MRDLVRRRYEAMAEAGELEPNPDQRVLAGKLDRLLTALADRARKSKGSALGWLLARGGRPPPPCGLYIWGPVGGGKTLLMDTFFQAVPTERKRRAHFHDFMADVHERIHRFRQRLKSGEVRGDDPIAPVAEGIAGEISLLCFDEFVVRDIADAMILGRLFEQLFARGVTLVVTSNVPLADQYKDGLNRALFLPFIALLEERTESFRLDAPRDYRLDGSGSLRRYVTPLGPEADACLDAHFHHLTGRAHGALTEIVHKGRRIVVPEAVDGVARFRFADLCARPLGAGDYLEIAEAFHTLIVADIPALGPQERNEARRLINLVDVLYDNVVRLIVSAEVAPEALFMSRSGSEAREFGRTVSRLAEMRSDGYWEAAGLSAVQRKTARVI
jgi:cell division protein ZapE